MDRGGYFQANEFIHARAKLDLLSCMIMNATAQTMQNTVVSEATGAGDQSCKGGIHMKGY